MPPKRPAALELLSCPKLCRGQSNRRAAQVQRQAGMHQHPAQGTHIRTTRLVAPAIDGFGEADHARLRAVIDKLRRILQNEDRPLTRSNPGGSCRKMTSQNAVLRDGWIIKEPIGRLGRRLVATCSRDRLTR